EDACDVLERIYESGSYPRLTVDRHWSRHNPRISGQIARPAAVRWYLRRELKKLLERGAVITIEPAAERLELSSPVLLERVDEAKQDPRKKKLFLFPPERVELSLERLEHYTGTRAEDFQRHILLTNYRMHMDVFERIFPSCTKPSPPHVQMPAYHHAIGDHLGVSLVNIGIGPSNAKNFTDHVAVLRPDALIMVGHCGGIRNHQKIGDFVLASGYLRADLVLDAVLPLSVPVIPNLHLNLFLAQALDEAELTYRIGTVYTTADRNWELGLERTMTDLRASRSLAIDMESATVAANGFRYRIPSATLLCVSDKPLHGAPKLPEAALRFYRETQHRHLEVALRALDLVREQWPGGLPNAGLRSFDEPLMGGPPD
ncbi:MAG TPA: AMP nucleosidase, partial [Planctomycetota bacterium]|nr:AMP nucleosidase [Planctomycetota bacterium]